MGLKYLSLDHTTRKLMLEEFKYDIECDNCYTSKRFHDAGIECYIKIMPKHLIEGNDDSLAEELRTNECFNTHETRGTSTVQVPVTAAQTFAEGEFNRFYMRGLALRAIKEDRNLEVYRARYSERPNPESEKLIGTKIKAEILLKDLRECKGIETTLGLPKPNSGLSIKLLNV